MSQHADILTPEPERISTATAMALVSLFLALIIGVPALQLVDDPGAAWRDAARRFADVRAAAAASPGPWTRKTLAANRELLDILVDFEHALADDAWLAHACRGPTQYALTRWLGAGNEKAYPGIDDWTLYRDDVDYVTGPGFLSAQHGAGSHGGAGSASRAARHAPQAAIVDFDRRLRERGATLLVMPVPVKPSLQPGAFYPAATAAALPLQNASFEAWKAELQQAGVRVFDCAPLLIEFQRAAGRPAYLLGDTHWRPDAMAHVARALAQEIRSIVAPPTGDSATGLQRGRQDLAALGDTTAMLALPDWQTLYPLESVTVEPVTSTNGLPWRRTPGADVMLLGDSFANIFSLPSMGWGASAGLAEQLSFELQRPVDRIVQNDNGAFATREALMQRLREGAPSPRLVVWEFTARELASGNWKPLSDGAAGLK